MGLDLENQSTIENVGTLVNAVDYLEFMEPLLRSSPDEECIRNGVKFYRKLLFVVTHTPGVADLSALQGVKLLTADWLRQQRSEIVNRRHELPDVVDAMTPYEFASAVAELTRSVAEQIGPAAPSGGGRLNRSGALAMAIGKETAEIMTIPRSDKSSSDKAEAICEIDQRFLEWDSPKWAEFLDVSEGAVRGGPFWKLKRNELIAKYKAPD